MPHILIVEDEPDLALGLQANLEVEGYEVSVAHTGTEGLQAAAARTPDLVLLDLMLPDTDGYAVLAALRARGMDAPVLILTARGEEVDKVRGFRTGADDYVTKPFGVMELLVRIQALLRRGAPRATVAAPATNGTATNGTATNGTATNGTATNGTATNGARGVLRFGEVEVDVEDRMVRRGDAEVTLTPRAFDLLLALLDKRGRVASRHDLLRDVWGYASEVTTRTVDAHVAELRRKLERNPAEPAHILTVWKVGYRLKP